MTKCIERNEELIKAEKQSKKNHEARKKKERARKRERQRQRISKWENNAQHKTDIKKRRIKICSLSSSVSVCLVFFCSSSVYTIFPYFDQYLVLTNSRVPHCDVHAHQMNLEHYTESERAQGKNKVTSTKASQAIWLNHQYQNIYNLHQILINIIFLSVFHRIQLQTISIREECRYIIIFIQYGYCGGVLICCGIQQVIHLLGKIHSYRIQVDLCKCCFRLLFST